MSQLPGHSAAGGSSGLSSSAQVGDFLEKAASGGFAPAAKAEPASPVPSPAQPPTAAHPEKSPPVLRLDERSRLGPVVLLRPGYFRRPPDWRRQLVEYLWRGLISLRAKTLDAQTLQLLQFRKTLGRRRGEAWREKLCQAMPDLFEAWQLWHDPQSREQCWEIEARLLARESAEAIASKIGCRPGLIEQYASAFYDVADRLAVPSFATHCLLRLHQQLADGSADGDESVSLETLWKFAGYWGGPAVLDGLIYQQPAGLAAVREFCDRSIRHEILIKAAIAVQCLDVSDPKVAIKVVRLQQRLDARGKRRGSDAEANIARNIVVFFEGLRRALCGRVPVRSDPLPAAQAGDEASNGAGLSI